MMTRRFRLVAYDQSADSASDGDHQFCLGCAQTGGGFLENTCYATSTGAILSMMKGIAREYGKDGITCNAICPGIC
ncbi:TPA: SDR family oxidoreductase [Klebsiella oxytoca]|nr:SDR family oxidoreductase [Klebsiella oxytoca]